METEDTTLTATALMQTLCGLHWIIRFFTFFMLMLVTVDNVLQMCLDREGVELSHLSTGAGSSGFQLIRHPQRRCQSIGLVTLALMRGTLATFSTIETVHFCGALHLVVSLGLEGYDAERC